MSVSAATFHTHSRNSRTGFPLASSSLSEGLVFAEGTALVLMLGLAVASTGLQLPTGSQPPSTRRALLSSTAAVAALALPGASFAAVKPCKNGATCSTWAFGVAHSCACIIPISHLIRHSLASQPVGSSLPRSTCCAAATYSFFFFFFFFPYSRFFSCCAR